MSPTVCDSFEDVQNSKFPSFVSSLIQPKNCKTETKAESSTTMTQVIHFIFQTHLLTLGPCNIIFVSSNRTHFHKQSFFFSHVPRLILSWECWFLTVSVPSLSIPVQNLLVLRQRHWQLSLHARPAPIQDDFLSAKDDSLVFSTSHPKPPGRPTADLVFEWTNPLLLQFNIFM